MKVLWLVPPIKGNPNIGQYRFYKNTPIRASLEYPYLNAMGVTCLDQAGFDVEWLDCPTKRKKKLPKINADLVVMEARTPILNHVFQAADSLREEGITVVLFGDHVTWQPDEALKHCDYVVLGGDFDYGVTQLCLQLLQGIDVNSKFDVGLVENLDSLPHVDREIVPWNDYLEAWKIRDTYLYTMSGRGCLYNCIFCAWITPLWHNRMRQRSVNDVVEEFWEAYEKYGKCYIWDDHDCFDTSWGLKFAKKLLETGNTHKEVLWAFQSHSNMIHDLSALKTMKKAGLHLVKLGIESGNQISLNKIKKGTTIKQHERAIKLLKEAEITVHANLMVGFPWEDKKQAYHTIEWIKKIDPNQAQFSLIIPYPWTQLFDMAKENGWLLVQEGDWDSYDATKPMLKMEGMTLEEIMQLYKDCWDKFYLNWHYKWKRLKTVRNWADLKQLLRGYYSVRFGHMRAIKS